MTTTAAGVPFLDLAGVNQMSRDALDVAWKSVLTHGEYVGGPEVERFERDFAAYCATRACVGVGNGTDALELILTGLGIGPGDEVIVPANTFIATAEAICGVGARPRFVDVLPDSLLIDADAVAAAVNPATAAVMAVHLYGQMADMDALSAVCRRYGLALVEDAAQAHGACIDRRRAGSVGAAAAFSFYPGKNLGALGDGGAVVTSDLALADRVRTIANHGRCAADRARHVCCGRNSRLDTLQAAVLVAKLPRLDQDNRLRREAMDAYRALLPSRCRPLAVRPGAQPVYHLAIVQVDDRVRATDALTRARIGWGVHYPVPCHRQPALREFRESLRVVEAAAERILSLPMSPTLRPEQIERVCTVLREAVE